MQAEVGRGAALTLTTQACERAYAAHGSECARLDVALDVAGHLAWLPQETILFERCRAVRRMRVDLAPGASLLMCEAVLFGRLARGECLRDASFRDRVEIRRAGRQIHLDGLDLAGDVTATLDRPAPGDPHALSHHPRRKRRAGLRPFRRASAPSWRRLVVGRPSGTGRDRAGGHPADARMIPGELLPAAGDITLNEGREALTLMVADTGDRPVQVGSHYHFAETNPALDFDRAAARGCRLDIPAGSAVRFDPGQPREVRLIAFAGDRRVFGFGGEVMGPL